MNNNTFGSVRERLLVGLTSAAMVATLVPAPALAETVVEVAPSKVTAVDAPAQDDAITVVDESEAVKAEVQDDEALEAASASKNAEIGEQRSSAVALSAMSISNIESMDELQCAIDEAPDGVATTITLTRDLCGVRELVIPAGKDITIEMNGCKLKQEAGDRRVITNNGTLTLIGDSNRLSCIDGGEGHVWGTGGCIRSTAGSVLTVEDCTITHGMATSGGGIYCEGTLTMSGSVIKENKAIAASKENLLGAGLFVAKGGCATLNDCEVEGNEIEALSSNDNSRGGGIYCEGDLSLNGGSVHGNKARYGAGICVRNGGSLSVAGSSICENKSTKAGGGIYLDGGTTLAMEGSIVVRDNESPSGKSNVQLEVGETIAITGALADGADIGIGLRGNCPIGVFTSGFGEHNPSASPQDFFHTADEDYSISAEQVDGEAYIDKEIGSWASLNEILNDVDGPSVCCLGADLTASEADGPLTVPEGRTVRLELCGHTIDRGLESAIERGSVLENEGSLTIAGGTVKGGMTTGEGGGILNGRGASLTLENVTVTGNNAEGNGGGVCNYGTLTLCDGASVCENAGRCGGGIVNMGELTLDGAVVKGNKSKRGGGGIYNCGTKLELLGSTEVTGNAAGGESVRANGGGLFNETGSISVGDSARVTGNTASRAGNDLYLLYDRSVNVVRSLTDEAQFGVTLESKVGELTVGYGKNGGGQSLDDVFKVDEGLSVGLTNAGEVKIGDSAQELAKFGYSVTLGDSIDIVFNVKDLVDDPENYTIEYGPTDGMMSVTRLSDPKLNTFTVASCAAKEMGETFDVVVTHKTSPDNDEIIKKSQYSVRDYCERVIERGAASEKSKDKAAVALCKATLDYGSHSQEELNYHTDSLVNGGTDFFDNAAIEVPVVNSQVSGSCDGITGQTISLNTTSRTQFVVLFKHAKGADKADYTFTVDGESYDASKVVDRNNKFEVWVDGISARDLAQEHTVTVSKGGETYSYTASPVVCLSKAIHGDKPVENPEVYRALYNYHLKAVDYFTAVGRG